MSTSQRAGPLAKSTLPVVVLIGWAGPVSCNNTRDHLSWDEQQATPAIYRAPPPAPGTTREDRLRFAVASMISPATTYDIYEEVLSHVATEAGRPYSFVQRRSYQEVNALLTSGQVDLAVICSGAFAMLSPDSDVEILAIPVVRGSPTYNSLIIARSETDITNLASLKGKRFAFTDPLSNSGFFYPLARLGDLGEKPATFFSSTAMTGSHDRSIAAVYRKVVDAAAVDSLVYHRVVTSDSRYAGKLRIVESSPAFPIPPFVSPRRVAPKLRRSFRQSLMKLHETQAGRRLLGAIGVDRFIEGDISSYEMIATYADRAQKVLRQ